jgi:hypothetical protein
MEEDEELGEMEVTSYLHSSTGWPHAQETPIGCWVVVLALGRREKSPANSNSKPDYPVLKSL